MSGGSASLTDNLEIHYRGLEAHCRRLALEKGTKTKVERLRAAYADMADDSCVMETL